jgi:murein DD-endopeptidase MepM/ murein hydrolase activator NlpD
VPCRASGGGWGGWFVLRADVPEGGAAYVVLGHLAHAGLPQAGARITRGTPIGVIGTPHENGGWYPHLHLQALSGEAWEAVQRAPDILLDGYGYPGGAQPAVSRSGSAGGFARVIRVASGPMNKRDPHWRDSTGATALGAAAWRSVQPHHAAGVTLPLVESP